MTGLPEFSVSSRIENPDSDTSSGSGRTSQLAKSHTTPDVGKKTKASLDTPIAHKPSRSQESFLLAVNGRIETGELFGVNDVYCKYNFSFGPDWQFTSVSAFNHEPVLCPQPPKSLLLF